jgi:hypothetical protein
VARILAARKIVFAPRQPGTLLAQRNPEAVELRMDRDVLKRSVVPWVKEATT